MYWIFSSKSGGFIRERFERARQGMALMEMIERFSAWGL
jgi:hypothetical protein